MDILIFKYSGQSSFVVEITWPNGDPKEGAGYRKVKTPKEHQDMEGKNKKFLKHNNAKGKRGKEVSYDTDDYQTDDSTDDGYWNDNNASGSRKPHPKRVHQYRLSSKPPKNSAAGSKRGRVPRLVNEKDNRGKGIMDKSSDEEFDSSDWANASYEVTSEQEEKAGHGNNKASTSRLPRRAKSKMLNRRISEMDDRGKGIASTDEDSYDSSDSKMNHPGKRFKSTPKDVKASKKASKKTSKIINRVDPYGRELFSGGRIPIPRRRYFVTRMKRNRRNELYIPDDIVRTVELPEEIKLVDEEGDKYSSWLVVWSDTRTMYKGGWNRLGRMRFLTEDDLCICEFGEGVEAGCLFIRIIRIIRGAARRL